MTLEAVPSTEGPESMTPDYGEPWLNLPEVRELQKGLHCLLLECPPSVVNDIATRANVALRAVACLADPAAEIEALRAERDRLREALEHAATELANGDWPRLAEEARAALRGPKLGQEDRDPR